ncbi:MAG: BCCT family transporter [Selenomonas sp.]|uniref:BCCT family transporter n=1 Tax=Selenomonas sp. TaxID=2053611 RepID=UPI0025EA9A67|nr:BCCT family transporter [Selenomonas sp.]MCR5758111.1 BCCT family transporter [Selenomonas sp.]
MTRNANSFFQKLLPGSTSVGTGAIVLLLIMVVIGAVLPTEFQQITQQARDYITYSLGWYYLLLVTGIVGFCLFFIISPMGDIRLGEPGTKPEYSKTSWLAMLFSAGMGIGLVFFGAAEPLSHYAIAAPNGEVGSQAALADALRYSFFHWGIHAWSVYAIIALSLAYFKFRKKERGLLSVTLKPLFLQWTERLPGKAIDMVCLIATAIGVATTLGFGAVQINSGLSYLFGLPENFHIQFIIILAATVCFLASAITGVDRGIQLLSNINVLLALLLLVVVLAVGPTVHIMNAFVDTVGAYFQQFIRMSFRTAAFNPVHHEWIEKWTIFYWAWWLSWAPFVGTFIARISKGRTIREFLTHVMLIPTLFSFLWFSVFGILAVDAYDLHPELAQLTAEQILFGVFNSYSLGITLSIVAVFLIFCFFITSADSATHVLAMLSENGVLTPHTRTKVVWGALIAAISVILLAAGGLGALQNMLMIIALPFSVVIILMMIALYIEVRHEQKEMGLYLKPEQYPEKGSPFRSYEDM